MLLLLGLVLVCRVFDGQPLPVQFGLSLYKYLLGLRPSERDLEGFHPVSFLLCYSTIGVYAAVFNSLTFHNIVAVMMVMVMVIMMMT